MSPKLEKGKKGGGGEGEQVEKHETQLFLQRRFSSPELFLLSSHHDEDLLNETLFAAIVWPFHCEVRNNISGHFR